MLWGMVEGVETAQTRVVTRLAFDVFDFRPATGELRRDGAPVAVQEKPRRLLEALLERPGELVTRDALCRCLWGDEVFVDFDANLNTAVRTLRRTLGDDASSPRFVATVPKRGYRFVAPVRRLEAGQSDGPRDGPHRRRRLGVLAAALPVAITAAVLSFSGGETLSELRDSEQIAPSASSDAVPESARRAVLDAREQWRRFDREGLERAAALYDQALAEAPGYAEAWAGLAETYNLLAWEEPGPRTGPHAAYPRALEAAERALVLDPSVAEAHAARAFALLYFYWDFAEAERSFRRAVELAPAFAMAHHYAAGLFAATGRHDEAIAAMLRAEELDPVSLSIRSDLGWYYLFARRPDEGLEACGRTLADDPRYGWAIACLREAHRQRGDLAASADAARRWLALGRGVEGEPSPVDAPPDAVLRSLLEIELHRDLHRRRQRPSAFALAADYAALGRADDALRWLERAVDARDGWVIFAAVHPRFESLHGDSRYRALLARLGLPLPTS
ncbi:MAG: winged helix-turn-helix domain-containing protein [Acidobacteriota bacterium]